MRRRLAALGAAVALAAGACTGATDAPRSTGSPTGVEPTVSPSPGEPGRGSALKALDRLCPRARVPGGSTVPVEGPTPRFVRRVQTQVSDIRGLAFTRSVPVDAVTREELVEGLEGSFDSAYPRTQFERRSEAWATIGVVEPGTDIRTELEEFASSQVIGYYDTVAEQLVFIGTDGPSPAELVTLAHELTHALDDQHFGLQAVERLGTRCRDDAFAAALAVAEGDATYVMIAFAQRNLSLDEQLGLAQGSGAGTLGDVPAFLVRLQAWPYTAGLGFVRALVARGGTEAVDTAFREPPVSSEQVLHPEAYPDDVPTAVDIPNLARTLGEGWRDLDVYEVGEAWLATLLGLRLDGGDAEEAAAGWDGGIYRAWSDGERIAVVLSTAWDSTADAQAFASAMREWLTQGDEIAEVRDPTDADARVDVLFASDAPTLAALGSATS